MDRNLRTAQERGTLSRVWAGVGKVNRRAIPSTRPEHARAADRCDRLSAGPISGASSSRNSMSEIVAEVLGGPVIPSGT